MIIFVIRVRFIFYFFVLFSFWVVVLCTLISGIKFVDLFIFLGWGSLWVWVMGS